MQVTDESIILLQLLLLLQGVMSCSSCSNKKRIGLLVTRLCLHSKLMSATAQDQLLMRSVLCMACLLACDALILMFHLLV